MWGDVDKVALIGRWADELEGFTMGDMKGALDALRTEYPAEPPTLFQFRQLCVIARRRRAEEVTKLEDKSQRTEMPDKVREQLREFHAKHVVGKR